MTDDQSDPVDRSDSIRRRPPILGRLAPVMTIALLTMSLLAGGCATAGKAVGGAASASIDGIATATAAAATATTTAANEVWTTIWPWTEQSGPDAQRAKMREQAGPDHFRNEGFTDARDGMKSQSSAFQQHREQFVSNEFTASRDRFRNGRTQPQSGLVIGPGITDPDVIRALLAQAALHGVPVFGVQPVLAALLPAFGQ